MGRTRYIRPDTGETETLQAVAKRIKDKSVVFFGELHQQQLVIDAQMDILRTMSKQSNNNNVALVFEMFNIRQQTLLDGFMQGKLNLQEVQREYNKSLEGFDILHHYGQLLTLAKQLRNVKPIAGFVPRELAKGMIKEPDETLNQIESENLFNTKVFRNHPGSDLHYATFVGLLNGVDIDPNEPIKVPSAQFRPIFRAQLLKDASLAARVLEQINEKMQVLVICGSGHSDWSFGAPERLDIPRKDIFIISARIPETSLENKSVARRERCDSLFYFE